MPELNFKGKEYVYNHHLTVPYRPLLADAAKSVGPGDMAGNLIIHGDNLHALKSLLPRYAGKVDLVFIDPPYNTGNENWSYNDNVNSPIMQEWLRSNPVNAEDMLRHDKWLCMMWPRLVMLRELLSERGSLWMTLDDNEVHRARMMLEEIFGEESFITEIEWQKRYTRSNNTDRFTSVIDHILVFRKSETFEVNLEERSDEADARYTNPDSDPRGPWKAIPFLNPATCEQRPNLCYEIRNPFTKVATKPGPKDQAWRNEESVYLRHLKEERFWWGAKKDKAIPDIKRFLSEVKQGIAPINFWSHQFAGNTDDASRELKNILGEKALETIKPVRLLERIVNAATTKNSIVLDSFAGSGTTAHGVLNVNAADGGTREFILVESEDYAERLTAQRLRQVILGHAYVGSVREVLLSEHVSWSRIQKPDALVQKVEAVKAREGFSDSPDLAQVPKSKRRFDQVNVRVENGELLVEGEKRISERVEGLGGEFTFCTLGNPIDPEGILSGKSLPDYESMGSWLFYTATGATLDRAKVNASEFYLGEAQNRHLWLVYKPDLNFMMSVDAALTLSLAKKLRAKHPNKGHLVFAAAKFLSNKQLLEHGVEFAPLPFAMYREA